MLTPEELAQLEGAESLFPSPIPVQYASRRRAAWRRRSRR